MFIGSNFNNTLSQNVSAAQASSIKEKEDSDMERAIRLSLASHNVIDVDRHTPIRGHTAKKVPEVIVLFSPEATVSHTPTKQGTGTNMINQVKKRAFKRSQLVTDLVDADNPTSSPLKACASPYASKVFDHLADKKNKPSVAQFVDHYVEDNPFADSQEVYEHTNDYLRGLEGQPLKKRSKKK